MLGEPPAALATVKTAIRSSAREACLVVARTWRLRRDLTESYAAYANRIEKEFGLGAMHFTWEQLASTETFQVLERKLQELVMRELLAKSTGTLVGLAVTRQSSFWAEYLPEVQAQWALIVAAGQLLLEADRIEQTLKTATHEAGAMFRAYTTGEHPWCLLDTCYRRMEHRYYDFGFHLQDQDEQLLSRARQRYMHVGSTLAETFLQAYKGQKFRMEGILRQLDIFKKKVMPVLAQGKVAYVWVDALRYEMGYELAQSMAAEAETHIEAALGTVPTITEIGMASLLPIDKEPVSVVAIGESKLALEIGGTCIKERKDRVTYLTSHAGPEVRVFEAKLDDLLPKPNKKVRDGISNADLVLITSQEIDVMGEEGNLSLARQTTDEMLRQLRKAFRVLGQLGVKTIIYTADHGHLFADELSDDMKIDAPGGDTRDLHRRVWIGHGGTADASYMRAKLADFGLGGGLEIAVPWNFACFKVKSGAEAYFHGGMSPQELFIPVVVLSPKRVETGMTGEISWNLMPGSQKISTRLYSVQIAGKASSLFELVPPKVRLEMHDGAQTVSLPISASYGFDEATSDVQLKIDEQDSQSLEPNTITLVITEPQPKATVSIHLIDVVSGVELARLDKVEMVIAI